MSIGKGIAIAGIWIGVGISSFGLGAPTIILAVIALIATDELND